MSNGRTRNGLQNNTDEFLRRSSHVPGWGGLDRGGRGSAANARASRPFSPPPTLLVDSPLSMPRRNGSPAKNVLGGTLRACSTDPLTGFYRTGRCETGPQDRGNHVVCAEMTAPFLRFTKTQGNDLTTPHPDLNFPGLEPGDRWCLCAARWQEALAADVAPPVVLAATQEQALEVVSLPDLRTHALDDPKGEL